jgi:hypothetical protein
MTWGNQPIGVNVGGQPIHVYITNAGPHTPPPATPPPHVPPTLYGPGGHPATPGVPTPPPGAVPGQRHPAQSFPRIPTTPTPNRVRPLPRPQTSGQSTGTTFAQALSAAQSGQQVYTNDPQQKISHLWNSQSR